MAGIPETVLVSASQGQDARTSSDSQASAPASALEDFRVRCTLKRAVVEVMELCGRFVQELGAALPEDIRELALRDAQWTFESAVQENVSINGQAWQEAADHCLMDSDIKVLEDEFDELIVDVATKRRQYPRRILESVIKTLKAQHEILKQYRPVVPPLDLNCDPDPASHVENLKCRGDAIAKKINDAMKEHECLEQENAVLRREISKLKEELRHLSEALKEHEKMCPLLLCPMNFMQVRPDPVANCLPR
ncbi:kinetochore-associated protein NSL1 homolog isoform X2 [Onychomys torridus]|uniref:kinetochore-associated protein NSL1 homolog isoform X2 n=1 Tax=Onychomys torridus TaxID=38674 RepID=UPI00167F7F63|nr:kinetochore-associated protein NSL1 homolog isoform X2 [Onychomys torridus]